MINKSIALTYSLLLLSMYLTAQQNIQLNQLGFYPYAPKMAVVTKKTNNPSFYILDTKRTDTVYKGLLSRPIKSVYSSTTTRIAHFSGFNKPGKYTVSISNIGHSWVFEIKDNVLSDVAQKSLKAFYYQRVSMPLEEKYAGKWHRAAGHPDTAVLVHSSAATLKKPEGTRISTPGGWYDAGDVNKHIVNAGITLGNLLMAYEDFKDHADKLQLNIPESGNGLPDILNEILYEIRWMLTMQDADDGGVYNKCADAEVRDWAMPGTTKLPRYVVQKGTAATLDFVAILAKAARIYKGFTAQLPGFTDSCLHAAEYAWQWAEKNPKMLYNQDSMNKIYKPVMITGGYSDNFVDDEWFWAACELFITTHKNGYLAEIKKGMSNPFTKQLAVDVHPFGVYSLLHERKAGSLNISLLKTKLLDYADHLLNGGNKAFATVLGQSSQDYTWGCNTYAATQSIVLLKAYEVSGNRKYVDAALTNIDHILGRNATGYCFMTGVGSKSTMHPSHSASIADGIEEPVPGLMAGGPNQNREERWIDTCQYQFTEPEIAYLDKNCAYASNEPSIDGNSALFYVANAIEALQYVVGYSKKTKVK